MTTQPTNISQEQVESGKLFAILSYLVPFFFLVPLIQKNNRFAFFHARQALAIVLLAIVIGAATMLLPASLLGIVSPVLLIAQLALIVFGVFHAAKGLAKQLPILGPVAERVFEKINLKQLEG